MKILIDNKNSGKCIREILENEFGFSSSMIKKLKFCEGGITVDGKFATVRHVLSEGETLSLAVEDTEKDVNPYTIANDIPIDVIFEDEWLTVVNKPSGMPAHPSLGHKLDTVSNALAYRYRDRSYVFRPVNRLDRDTSGCMITANTKLSSYRMYLSMTEGMIKKYYIAVTDGRPDKDCGVIESYMRREEGSIIRRIETVPDDPEGKIAVTEFNVIYTNNENSIIGLSPITGRTHQIRVQLAGIGCPVTGDDLYGTSSPFISRQALHSSTTLFPHPESSKKMKVCAALPEDMVNLIKALFRDVDDIIFSKNREDNAVFFN